MPKHQNLHRVDVTVPKKQCHPYNSRVRRSRRRRRRVGGEDPESLLYCGES
jgi:hypothetical protein